MEKFETIYVDLDGVLANFTLGAFEAFGLHGEPHDDYLSLSPAPYAIWDHWMISEEVFFHKLRQHGEAFWANLARYPWTTPVLAEAERNAKRVVLVSSPTDDPSSWLGKRQWCKSQFGERYQLILCSEKWRLANSRSLLIDDSDEQCDAFCEAGGWSLLFPAPWNQNHEIYHDDFDLGAWVGNWIWDCLDEINDPMPTAVSSDASIKQFDSGAVRSSDADATRYDLMSPIAMRRIAEAYHEGAQKYSDYNWEKGMPVSEMLNHALRHVYLYLQGDRGEDHLSHAGWNLCGAMHSEECWPHLNSNLRLPGCVAPTEVCDGNQ